MDLGMGNRGYVIFEESGSGVKAAIQREDKKQESCVCVCVQACLCT